MSRVRKSSPERDRGRAAADGSLTAKLPQRRVESHLAEISLVAAIFQDAVRSVVRRRRGENHPESEDALDWITSERRDWPFSFANVCDFLGIDAELVRIRLLLDHGENSSSADDRP